MIPSALPSRGDMVVSRWGARFLGRHFPCAIGRGGIADEKREGDGVTPAGVWRLMGGGYRADRLARPDTALHLRAISPWDVWSDDPGDPAYNHSQRSLAYPHSHEKLRISAPLYDIFLISDQNWPNAVPGQGSALFVHNWRRPRFPTAGCIAFRPDHLRWILSHWTSRTRILVR